MRIAMLAAGNAIHTVRWVNALAERGLDVHLFSLHEFSAGISSQVQTVRLPIPPPAGYFANSWFLNRHLRRLRPDLLHSHYASGYGTLGRLARHRPKLLSVWGSDVYSFPDESRLHRKLLAANLRSADQVCSTSHAMAQQAQRICPEIRDIVITPFGVDVRRFAPADVHCGSETIVIGTVKSLAATYGIDLLIRGFADCRRRFRESGHPLSSRLRLKIAGRGPDRARLERLARKCGVADATEFLGAISHDEVPSQLNSFDIFVAVSRSESFGVSVIEASACELPVVVSDVGGLPEVVVDGETGFVIAPENPPALAAALEELILNPELRSAMGAAGRRFVVKNYDWAENVARMESVYERLLALRAAA